MKSETEWNRMMSGKLYSPTKVGDNSWEKVHEVMQLFNSSAFWKDRTALNEFRKCFGKAPEDIVLIPPLYILTSVIEFTLGNIFMQIQD